MRYSSTQFKISKSQTEALYVTPFFEHIFANLICCSLVNSNFLKCELRSGFCFLLTKESMHRFWSLFRGNISDDENPYFNLMHQEDLSNSLDTLIITAGFDPLRDEAEVYAKKLNRSGARVRQLHYPDLFHGFVNLTGLRACKTAVDDMIDEMRNFYE